MQQPKRCPTLGFVEKTLLGITFHGWVLTSSTGTVVESTYRLTKPAMLSDAVDVLGTSLLDPALIIKDDSMRTRGLLISAVRRRFKDQIPLKKKLESKGLTVVEDKNFEDRGHGDIVDIRAVDTDG